MSFWAFCCKFPQVYRPWHDTAQYPNERVSSAGGYGLPQLDGCGDPAIDSQGDWVSLSDYAGVKSDGTLWCWIQDVVQLRRFRETGQSGIQQRPYKISDETGWVWVTSNQGRGFAKKSDGSLWAFGRNNYGSLGIGLGRMSSSAYHQPNHYRAKLSCGIKAIHPFQLSYYSKKPTVSIVSTLAGDTAGSQPPTLNVKWTGYITGHSLTSGGSGYNTTPAVSLVGVGDDAGKALGASAVTMTPAYVESLSAISGGSGYTYATATIAHINFVALGAITDGVVTGWTIANYGASVTLSDEDKLELVVTGDGEGAAASFTLSKRSVNSIDFPDYVKMWTAVPTIAFSGGGGSGAIATVSGLSGTVDEVEVVSPGSGFTQQPWSLFGIYLKAMFTVDGETTHGGSVELLPGVVSSVVLWPNGASLPPLAKASTGKVFPFSYIAYGSNASTHPQRRLLSVKLKSPTTGDVSLTVSGDVDFTTGFPTVANSSVRSGYTYPPFVVAEVGCKPKSYDSLVSDITHVVTPPCEYNNPYATRTTYCAPGMGFEWPVSGGTTTQTINGSNGSTATYENIDGHLLLSSRSWTVLGTWTNIWEAPQPQDHSPINLSLHTGVIWRHTTNLRFHPYLTSDIDFGWSTPTIDEVVRLYFEPPTHGGQTPTAHANPVGGDEIFGYGTQPVLDSNGGGLYKTEPLISPQSEVFDYPVRVGSDTWLSASISGDLSLGVKSDGKLYWWGEGAANGPGLPCVSPSPVGQGATLQVSASADMPERGLYGGYAQSWNSYDEYSPSIGRISFSIPSHGVYHCDSPVSWPITEDTAGNNSPTKTSNAGSHPTYFTPEADFLHTSRRVGGGLGYVSTPTLSITEIGGSVATFTARLFGPSAFTEVYEDCAKDGSGVWHRVAAPPAYGTNRYVSGPLTLWSYSTVASGGPGPDESASTTTRTASGVAYPVTANVSAGGSGYTNATLTVTYQPIPQQDYSASTAYETVDCDGGVVNVRSTTTITRNLVASPQTTSSSDMTLAGTSVAPGFIFPPYYYYQGVAAFSASISGNGAGASAYVNVFTTLKESHLEPMTQPGVASFSNSTKVGLVGTDVYSFPQSGTMAQGYLGPSGYKLPGIANVASTKGSTARKSDGSVWRVIDATDASHVSACRVMPLELKVTDTGKGYGDAVAANVTAQTGVAKASVTFDAKIMAIGVLSPGRGYTSPPALTISASQGTVGTAQAVIAGPIAQVKVTAGGSGYRVPPKVKFVGPGIRAKAFSTLNEAGGVAGITVTDGGRYRNAAPTITIEPVVQVGSLTLTSGGSSYTKAPKVFVGGGGGIGATAECTISAVVQAIEIENGGANYTSPPSVVITGGDGTGATATATVSNGVVTSISITNGGEGYRSAPLVYITGGGGYGAIATARISGQVDSITLLNRGEGFVQAPTVVFHDGGGNGAAATATISGAGSGATATAVLDGSIIFCTHSGSSGLQEEPTITVSDSQNTNYRIKEYNDALSSGAITQQERDKGVGDVAGRVKTRIIGKVTGISVSTGGTDYVESQDLYWLPPLTNKKFPAVAQVSAMFAESGSSNSKMASNDYAFFAMGDVSGGAVTSLSMQNGLENVNFWKKPWVRMADGMAADPYTCLTLAGSAVREAETVAAIAEWQRDPVTLLGPVHNGIRLATRDPLGPGAYWSWERPVGGVSLCGEIHSFTFAGDFYQLKYSPLPTVEVQDECGSAASVTTDESMNFTINNHGSGYTFAARVVLTGGTPIVWSNAATATATVQGGSVSSAQVTSQGDGYTKYPTVLFKGGGGTGASATANVVNFKVTSITITNAGSGYTSAPEVVIIDKERQFQDEDYGKQWQARADTYCSALLQNYKAEYCFETSTRQRTLQSPIGMFEKAFGAYFVPLFEDNGYVEGIEWNLGIRFISAYNAYGDGYRNTRPGYFCGVREISSAPSVAPVGRCSREAAFGTLIVSFTDTFSENAIKANIASETWY